MVSIPRTGLKCPYMMWIICRGTFAMGIIPLGARNHKQSSDSFTYESI